MISDLYFKLSMK